MKRIVIIFLMLFSAFFVSAHNHDHECNHSPEQESVTDYPQQYVQVTCPNCAGYKVVVGGIDYWGNPVYFPCPYCQGRGWIYQLVQSQPSFQGRTPYYAECNRTFCKCKLFVPKRTGSSECTCGHSMQAHTKRYL